MTHLYLRRPSTVSALAALLLTTLAGNSLAQSTSYDSSANRIYNPSWYIAPSINAINPDNKFGTVNSGSGFGLRMGKPVSPTWDIQFGVVAAKSTEGAVNYKQETIGLDGLYFLSRERFRPFLLMGIGTQHDQVINAAVTRNSNSPYLSAGLGAQWSLGDQWGMQVDYRRSHAYLNGNDFAFNRASTNSINIGLMYSFGKAPDPAPIVRAPPEPRIVYVEKAAPVVAAPAPLAQASAPVAAIPAPIAPIPAPPPAPVVVPPRFERVTLAATENFGFDSYALSRPQPKLDEIAGIMQRYPDVHMVMITGYSDRLGASTYNQALSQRRADAVKSYLMTQGVAANRLNAAGKGDSNPVAVCTNTKRADLIECLEPNRRVEVEQFAIERRVP
jgi:OmpA-OmpF porin, OOP family